LGRAVTTKSDITARAIERLWVDRFLEAPPDAAQIILDLDAPDDSCMGIRKAASSMP
jgi:hypothetical protein